MAAAGATFALPADVFPINQQVFGIPIRMDPNKRALIRNLELYVSTNQGATWDLVGSATPDKDEFKFEARADGMHWFYVMSYDLQGRKEPPQLNKETVQQKILIDTLRPDVRLKSVARKNDAVVVDWEIKEENPDLNSLKLEYKSAEGADWVNVPVAQNLVGQATIQTPAGVVVRLSMKDVAENTGKAEAAVSAASGLRTVSAVVPVATGAGAAAMPPAGPPAVVPAVSEAPAGVPPTIGTSASEAAASTGPVKPVATSAEPVKPTSPAATPKLPGPPGIDDLIPPPVDSGKLIPPPGLGDPPPGIGGVGERGGVAASRHSPTPPAVAPGVPPPGDRPAVQPVNNRRVTLEYEVARYGPSGIGSVDLYITRDDGLTWQPIAAEHGTPLSTPADPKQPGNLRRTLSVNLTDDGAYGFYMVVKSGAGLGRGAPRAPEPPQIRVELDTLPPKSMLFKPEAQPGQRDALVISWQAADKNLAANPITIQWAEQKNGPWEFIGGPQLPNGHHSPKPDVDPRATGSYSWQPPANIPYKVYMRLTVRDAAGNVAVAETETPVDVDLTMPEYRLIGVVKDRN